MYSTCLFCHADLGRNEVVEPFPVGRRLAYDAERGRLWVVCRRCERWNLTPLEERWEAIEAAERLYRGTRARVATEQVGMARLRDGKGAVELVRIGRPLRPEFAAWRYGDQFGRRRRKHLVMLGAAAVVGGGIVVAGPVMGLFGGSLVSPMINLVNVANGAYRRRKVTRVRLPGGEFGEIIRANLGTARLVLEGEQWSLTFKVTRDAGAARQWYKYHTSREHVPVTLTGEDAVRAAGALLPAFNAAGGSERRVQEAVRLIEGTPDPEALFRDATRETWRRWHNSSFRLDDAGAFKRLPVVTRLALEMAAHEETERRAMEGELALLEAAWRDAEEIAKIADDLALPEGIGERLKQLKADS